ncbi:MAG TPA: helix-hairpin-helix domain-containing protein [Geobacteraceae bacterium]|nr:helix-hairpin-helix domain-containing protein [Geobacteraceae bacterium]
MKKKKTKTISGIITRVFFNQDGFFSGILELDNCETVRVCGALTAKENDAVILHGDYEQNKYGTQFRAVSFEYDMDFDTAGIIHYLTNNPEMKGIGPQRARAIAEYCGPEFDRIVSDDPTRLLAIKGLTPEIVEKLHSEWLKYKTLNKTITFLAAFGITHKQVNTLIDKYGNFALQVMKENPYKIIEDISGYGFKRADTIALKMGVEKADSNRVRAALIFLAQKAVDDGDTWVEAEDLITQANRLLIMDTLDSREIIESQLEEIISSGVLLGHHYDNRLLVSLPSIFHMEAFIGDTFKQLRA